MTTQQAERRLEQLEKQLARRRDESSYWHERLECLRVLDRAKAKEQPTRAPTLQVVYIYVASSWRNKRQPLVVTALRGCADVYDFREPTPGGRGFAWSEIDEGWERWSADSYTTALDHPIAVGGFRGDMNALAAATACVLVLPCGRSAHLEAGYAKGAGKPLAILLDPDSPIEPELMYAMADLITTDLVRLANWVMDRLPTPRMGSWR